ncbi:hypothetical protein ACHAWF_002507 [Thalassiosira exigua]
MMMLCMICLVIVLKFTVQPPLSTQQVLTAKEVRMGQHTYLFVMEPSGRFKLNSCPPTELSASALVLMLEYDDTAVAGAYKYDDKGIESGAAHVFIPTEGEWFHQHKLLAPDGAAGDWFGSAVAIWGDTVVVSEVMDDHFWPGNGPAHLYARNRAQWAHQQKLLAPDGAEHDVFGLSVGIHNNTVVECNG